MNLMRNHNFAGFIQRHIYRWCMAVVSSCREM